MCKDKLIAYGAFLVIVNRSSIDIAMRHAICSGRWRLSLFPYRNVFFSFPVFSLPVRFASQPEENHPHVREKSLYTHTHIIYIYSSTLNKRNSLEKSRTVSRERLFNLGVYSHIRKHVYKHVYTQIHICNVTSVLCFSYVLYNSFPFLYILVPFTIPISLFAC